MAHDRLEEGAGIARLLLTVSHGLVERSATPALAPTSVLRLGLAQHARDHARQGYFGSGGAAVTGP